jgi:hypothetical protein
MACDIPSGVPNWETRWVVRAEETAIPLASFLPGQITEAPGACTISINGGTVIRTLGDLCAACAPFNGMTVPKPAFTTTLQSEVAFPVDLDSITLASGTIRVRVINGLPFDPIRPAASPAAERGGMTIVIRNGTTVLGTHVIDGASRSFAPASTLLETVTFSSEGLPRTIGGTVAVEVTITSPIGDPVAINTADYIQVEAADAAVGATAAKVRVESRTVSASPMSLDLDGIDAGVVSRIQRGSLLLHLGNPLAVGGTLTATLSAPGVNLVRPFALVPGVSQAMLPFTGDELRSLFGPAPVTLTVSGPVSAVPAGLVTVLPMQQITATGRLELILSTNDPEAGR